MWQLLKQTFQKFSRDDIPRVGAALSYYTAFSLAPLLVISLAIAGFFLGPEAATGKITGQISSLVGTDAGKAISDLLKNASNEKTTGAAASIAGVIALVFGASGVFGQLQDAFHVVWNVRPEKKRGFLSIIRYRWLSIAMVLGVGFMLLVSLVISTVMSLFTDRFLPSTGFIAVAIDLAVSIAFTSGMFALIFKYLPSVNVPWRCAWKGALLSAVLFTLGKSLIGFYLGQSAVSSTFGAAGSLAVVLLWAYYSSQILLFGAEFSEILTRDANYKITPNAGYELLPERDSGDKLAQLKKPQSRLGEAAQ